MFAKRRVLHRRLSIEPLSSRYMLAGDFLKFSDTQSHDGHDTIRLCDSDNMLAGAQPLYAHQAVFASLDAADDIDLYRVEIATADQIMIDLDVTEGSQLDSYLRFFDESGNELLSNDNAVGKGFERSPLESYLESQEYVQGVYYIGVSSSGNSSYSAIDGTGQKQGNSSGGYVLKLSYLGELVVTSLSDESDTLPGDGVAETADYRTSLRAALEESNASRGLFRGRYLIAFDIQEPGPWVIRPQSALPNFVNNTWMFGQTNAAGLPLITIDGSSAGNASGLVLVGANNILQSLNVHSFSGNGIDVHAYSTTLRNLRVGTDQSGLSVLPNGGNGIVIRKYSVRLEDSTIASNASAGVLLAPGSKNNILQRNMIGLNAQGTVARGNGTHGIFVVESSGNELVDNNISGNVLHGIAITGAKSTSNRVVANTIGLGSNNLNLGNGGDGVRITQGASGNQIGAKGLEGNTISANQGYGVSILGADSRSNSIEQNTIGLGFRDNRAGNGRSGIVIQSSENRIELNTIADNAEHGILFSQESAFANVVVANFIGQTPASGRRGNGASGIHFASNSHSNQVGAGTRLANTIANNGADGVSVDNLSHRNRITRNAIFDNLDLGIDLGTSGYDLNDPGDADEGANRQQNHPVLEAIVKNLVDQTLSITYRIPTAIENATFPLTIEFYLAKGGLSENRQGTFLAGTIYTDNMALAGSRTVVYSSDIANQVAEGNRLIAIAIDADGNTSEFSLPRIISQ